MMNHTPVWRRAEIHCDVLAFFVGGAVLLAGGTYVASLAMRRWPPKPPSLTDRHFTLNMPATPQPAAPTGKQLSAWIRVIFQGPPAGVPAAEKHLTAAGDAALPALRHALAQPTLPSIRQRLRHIRAAIVQADALRGAVITLKLKNATLQTVFTKLCVPEGINPDFYPMFRSLSPPPPCFQHDFINITVQRQPFWQVMRQIALITGVGPTADGFAGQDLHIGGNLPMQPGVFGSRMPVDIQGAFVIALQWPRPGPRALLIPPRPASPRIPIYHRLFAHALSPKRSATPGVQTLHVLIIGSRPHKMLIPGSAPVKKKLLLLMNVLWCPTGNRLITFGPMQITQAVDNTGKSLLVPARPEAPRSANWNSDWSASGQKIVFCCQEWLKHPSPHAKVLSSLRGRFPVQLCLDRREYQLNNISSGKARFYWRGLKVQFGPPILKSPATGPTAHQRWRVRMRIDSGVASQRQRLLAGHLAQQFQEMAAVKFYTADGTYLGTSQPDGYYNANWNGSYDYDITGGKPVRARIVLYRQIKVKLSVPFVLKNVPLPR